MTRLQASLLSAAERDTLNEQTLTVLEEVGVAYNTPAAMDLLEGTGAVLDRERLTARLPRELVERCLETTPRKLLLAARDPAHDVWLGDGSLSFTTDGTVTYVVDDESGERHEASAADLRTLMPLFDALPNADYVWPIVSARDLDPLTANLEIEAISFRSCAKHVQDEVRSPEFVAPLLEMIAAVGGAPVAERPVFSTINCTLAPLDHDGPMTEASIALARAGVPIVIMPLPLMGTTGADHAWRERRSWRWPSCSRRSCSSSSRRPAARSSPRRCRPPPTCAAGSSSPPRPRQEPPRSPAWRWPNGTTACPPRAAASAATPRRPTSRTASRRAASSTRSWAPTRSSVWAASTASRSPAWRRSSCTTRPPRSSRSGCARCRSTRPRACSTTSARWGRAVTTWRGPARAGTGTTPGSRPCCAAAPSRRIEGRTLVQDALERARELLATHEVKPLPDDVDRHLDEVVAAHRRLALQKA